MLVSTQNGAQGMREGKKLKKGKVVSEVHIVWYNKEVNIQKNHEGLDPEVTKVSPLCQLTLPGLIPWQLGFFTCIID